MLLSLISIALSIYVITKLSGLSKRMDEMQGKKVLVTEKAPEEISATTVTTTKTASINATKGEPDVVEKFLKWYAHEWPLKTGALFILFGFIWLVTYAFLNNWIGPTGRVVFGLIAGAMILAGGEWRMRSIKSQGITLSWLGAAVMLVTIYAAQNVYHMFPSEVALAFILLIMVAMTFISLKHMSYSLVIASLTIASIAPFLIGAGEKNILSLYSYLLVVVLGVLWVVRYSKWRSLTLISLGIITFYSLEYFFYGLGQLANSYNYYGSIRSVFLSPLELLEVRTFAAIFASIFYCATLVPIVIDKKASQVTLVTAFAVGIFTVLFINALTPADYKGLITLFAALIYTVGAFLAYTRSGIKEAVYLYTGVGILLLAVATAFQFSGQALIIAFSIQALVIPIIAVSLLGVKNGKYTLAYFVLPLYLSLPLLITYDRQIGLITNNFVSLLVVANCMLFSGLYFYYFQKEKDIDLKNAACGIIIAGSAYVLFLLWKVNHVLITSEDIARMASLFVYMVIGLGTYITGQVQKRKVLYWYGLVLILAVIARLLLFEVWQMELFGRIITFFIVGILLIGSVLLRRTDTSQK